MNCKQNTKIIKNRDDVVTYEDNRIRNLMLPLEIDAESKWDAGG